MYAEEVNYWKTGKSSPDTWLQRTRKQIEDLGGKVLAEGFGNDVTSNRSAYMMAFEIHGNKYKVVWPVLESKTSNSIAARIQAATLLYHDIKARCISSFVLGERAAFFNYLVLPNGCTASEMTDNEALSAISYVSPFGVLVEEKP